MNGERMHPTPHLACKGGVDHAVALQPTFPFEGFGHDMNPEMSLPAREVPGMSHVLV